MEKLENSIYAWTGEKYRPLVTEPRFPTISKDL